jgi:transketolase
VWTPADPLEVRACVRSVPALDGPAYLRLGRNGEPPIHAEIPDIREPLRIRDGADGLIVTCGILLHETLKACDALASQGIHPSVLHLPTLRPFPKAAVVAALAQGHPVMTVEEHVATGGLGQEVATCIAKSHSGNHFRTLHTPMAFPHQCMGRDASLVWAGIDAASIASNYAALWTDSARASSKRAQ